MSDFFTICPYDDEDGIDCDECGLCNESAIVDEADVLSDDSGD